MRDCPPADILDRLVHDQLNEPLRQQVAQHVAVCDECQRKLSETRREESLQQHVAGKARVGGAPGQVAKPDAADPSRTAETWVSRVETEDDRELLASTMETTAAPQDSVDPQAPLAMHDFELVAEIGSGGMGTVYQARQKSLNKPVAIKVLSRAASRNVPLVKRFLREASAAAGMRHPNIVDVHGVGRTPGGGYFLVMDLVEGSDLAELVRDERIPPDRIPTIMAAVADAVEHAHQHGVIHRDLKPGNILVDTSGQVLVTDFGIAKLLTSDDTHLTNADEPMIGTPSYMAPEQVDSCWGEIGPRCDVYGIGGILYFLLTGKPPFSAGERGQLEVLSRVISSAPPARPSHIRSATSPALEAICMRCLRKKQTERYATAGDVAAALRDPSPVKATMVLVTPGEPPLGAVPPDSSFYVKRGVDDEFRAAIDRRDSIILLRGARQMGKTSLLARGLAMARRTGASVVLTDCHKLNTSDLATAESLFVAFGQMMADSLDLDVYPDDVWNARRGPSVNFERYVRREVLAKTNGPLVWALDEVDRLFACDFRSDVFGLFRAWHNERALDPSGPWSRLSMAIAYATEAHLFIADINQSPFNVGTRLTLFDFTVDQVSDLNQRYGAPLQDDAQLARFHGLLAGHPYLTHLGLYEMAARQLDMAAFEQQAESAEGLFGDHLQRMLGLLNHDDSLRDSARAVLDRRGCPSADTFYRLRGAGVVTGKTPRDARLRCQLYEKYLKQHML